MTYGYEVLARSLAEVCSGRMFGVMGDGNMAVLSYMDLHGLCEYHAARHEASAVSMAAGFARARQAVGVCTVTHGPGFTNSLTALDAAVKDRTPLLLVVGELPAEAVHHAQRVDHQALADAIGAPCVLVECLDRVPTAVEEAVRHAVCGRTPVILRVSHGAMTGARCQPVATITAGDCVNECGSDPGCAEPGTDPDGVDELATHLVKSARPLLIVGRGAVLSGAEDLVTELADRVNALVVTTLGAKGACASHPRCIGLIGGFAHPAASDAIEASDLIVALGASLNEFTTANGRLLGTARIVQVDLDERSIGRMSRCDLGMVSDVSTVLECLLGRIAVDEHLAAGYSLEQASALAALCRQWRFDDASDEHGLDPRTVVTAFDAAFPPDRAVVIDGGHLIEWSARHLAAGRARYWLPSLGAGSIGLSVSTAIGVALGSGLPTAVVVGDGSCMMNLGDLDSAVRLRARVCVLIINDQAYGAEIYKLRQQGLAEQLGLFATPSLADVAGAMGARTLTLRTTADLDKVRAVEWDGMLAGGPVVIDARVTRNVVSERLSGSAAAP